MIPYFVHDVPDYVYFRMNDNDRLVKSTCWTTYFYFINAEYVRNAKWQCHNPLFSANLFALWTQICCSWSRWLSVPSRLLHKKVRCSGLGMLSFQEDQHSACGRAPASEPDMPGFKAWLCLHLIMWTSATWLVWPPLPILYKNGDTISFVFLWKSWVIYL